MTRSTKSWRKSLPKKTKRKSVQVGEGDGVARFPVADPNEYLKAHVVSVSGVPVNKTIWIRQSDLEVVPMKGEVAHTNVFIVHAENPDQGQAPKYRVTNLVRDSETGDFAADTLLAE